MTLIVIGFSLSGCKKDSPLVIGPEPYVLPDVSIDKTSGFANEVLTINYWQTPQLEQYIGEFNGQEVDVYKTGATLNFLIPNVSPGSYLFKTTVDGNVLEYSILVVESPLIGSTDQLIQNFQTQAQTDFDSYQQYLDDRYGGPSSYPSSIQQDLDVWTQIEAQSQQAISQMSASEKDELASLLRANQEWIDAIGSTLINDTYNFKTDTAECKGIIRSGKEALENGETFGALGLGISAYWCGVNFYLEKKVDNILGKGAALLESTENQFMQITLINLISKRVDQLAKEVDELGGSPSIAEEMEDAGENKVSAEIDWCNGDRKSLFAKIRFRSVRESDAQFNTPYAPYANFYKNFIAAYQDYVATMTQPLVWRPEYRNASRVVSFNRFLSVPQNSVTNSNALLINTQIVNDMWEVIFATDENGQQSFDYDIRYDDGYVQLQKTFSGTVKECEYEFGSIGPGGGLILYSLDEIGQSLYGFQYLEMTTEPIGYAKWGCRGDSIDTSNDIIGSGEENTQIIVQQCSEGGIAALLCSEYIQQGYDDWFLPTGSVAMSLLSNAHEGNLISLPDSITIWTSASSTTATTVFLNTAYAATSVRDPFGGLEGTGSGMDKDMVLPVYAVRKF